MRTTLYAKRSAWKRVSRLEDFAARLRSSTLLVQYDPIEDVHLDDFATRFSFLKRKDAKHMEREIVTIGDIQSQDSFGIVAGIYSPLERDSDLSSAMATYKKDFDKVIGMLQNLRIKANEADDGAEVERIQGIIKAKDIMKAEVEAKAVVRGKGKREAWPKLEANVNPRPRLARSSHSIR